MTGHAKALISIATIACGTLAAAIHTHHHHSHNLIRRVSLYTRPTR